jgi:surface antigen
MNKSYTVGKFASIAAITLITGCVGSGAGLLGGNSGAYGLGSATSSPMSGIESAVIAAIIQNMAGSVLNGQIGSQLAPSDQNFRLQQLGGAVQSGAINQPQQWVNPQTGNTMALNPVGQQHINPQTQQQCRNLEETLILQNGKRIKENRRACLDSQTGQWNFVQ